MNWHQGYFGVMEMFCNWMVVMIAQPCKLSISDYTLKWVNFMVGKLYLSYLLKLYVLSFIFFSVVLLAYPSRPYITFIFSDKRILLVILVFKLRAGLRVLEMPVTLTSPL